MPTYNEEKFLSKIVDRVLAQKISRIHHIELIIVDDGSIDGTRAIIDQVSKKYAENVVAVFHDSNQGKGAAIATA